MSFMSLRSYVRIASRFFLRPRCPLCEAAVDRDVFCDGCIGQLLGDCATRCPVCAVADVAGGPCAECLKRPPAFSATVAAATYRHPLDRLIMRFKYGHDLTLVASLANLLGDAVASAAPPDLLVPVPLAPSRLRERGFNQALELCRPIAHRFQLPLRADILRRDRDSGAQAALPLDSRAGNVKGAFRSDPVTALDVVVVDDVMTSGATLREIAVCLRSAGARDVRCWVLARTPALRRASLTAQRNSFN
jgi:ComF family protein